ncbi:DNA-directed DNA polymerase [Leisingera methylohalidivorans DSM 14336]|uniref:DNA-directed DNA polymerase n=2 Tax=Leisingera methylohalidivorans TaxID=133924 RepID=V9VX68_9RHOB|nr:DNA-directed DNA polymerase [Leisingera methylohalidivorans DSM 14336]
MQDSRHFRTDQFLRKNSPNSGHPRYLVIGFDTEYQRETVTNADGQVELRNQVLSYQYSCRVITPDNADSEPHWSGIVLPKGRGDDKRLTVTEFVEHALTAGFRALPDLKVPVDVYLVAHFTRADVPGFSDFKDEASRKAMNLENVRNLFMNVSKDIDVKLKRAGGSRPIRLKVKIRDTIALAPTGAKSLAQLGDILGFEKLKLSDDPDKELHYKQHMAEFMEANWRLFREYAIRDAEICAQYTSRIIRLYCDKTGKFKLPVTLTSIGVDLIRSYWEGQGLDPLAVVAKEEVEETYWSKKHNQSKTRKKTVSTQKLHWNEDFFTECYHGGRNEQFWFGPAPEGVWYDYDLASAYPSAMALIGAPHWDTIRAIGSTDELLTRFAPDDLAFANVDFEFPDGVRYPVLPVRTENGLLFPRKGNSTTHISEILLAKQLGCRISLVEGRQIDCDRIISRTEEYAPAKRPFIGFASNCINERLKHPKKSLDNLFWKELVNSTYGKTAQGLRERRIYDLRDAETKPLEPSKITNPVFAAFITAFCRGVLGEIMNALPPEVQIFSVTTDGFLTTATDKQMRAAAFGPLGRRYLDARRMLAGEWGIYEIKHVIRQPVGWRTRGQATLQPSSPSDWEGTGMVPKEDERVVLAKGGIKLDGLLSKSEQNAEITRLFFERKPTDKLLVTMGAGIREMYEQGMDFVDKTMDRRLSMEFDWKRRPAQAGEVSASYGSGKTCKHLAFSTGPWDTVEQFNTVRAIWSQYNKEAPHCLKTVRDYQAFASYFEGKLAAQGDAGRYLAKADGPLKRLRRDLAIAHKLRKAGTHELKPNAFGRERLAKDSKLKVKELAEFLADALDVPCTKTDLDNARKKTVFTPHQVPRTAEAVSVLEAVRRELFPLLEIDQFVTPKAAFSLDVASADMTLPPRDRMKD